MNGSLMAPAERRASRGVLTGFHNAGVTCSLGFDYWVAWCRVDGSIVAVCDEDVITKKQAAAWCAAQRRMRG